MLDVERQGAPFDVHRHHVDVGRRIVDYKPKKGHNILMPELLPLQDFPIRQLQRLPSACLRTDHAGKEYTRLIALWS
jgi:hypothetical protein